MSFWWRGTRPPPTWWASWWLVAARWPGGASILRVAVHPDYQGQGIATRLVEGSFRELCKQDLDEVELDVDIIKAAARHLYEKMGFTIAETFTPDIEEDDSFFLMRRKLEPCSKNMAE